MLVLHAADLHLDSPLRGLSRLPGCPVDAIRGAARRALTNLVDLALERRAELLLIAGDLYDGTWKDYATGLFFVREMARLAEVGTRVVLIRGNHDAESEVTQGLRLPPHVTELATAAPQTLVLDDLGVAIHGQGFARRDVKEDLARGYPKPVAGAFNIGLLHTALTGREGHADYAPCSAETLVDKGYDYWALGHVHQREIVRQKPLIVFPGNLQGRHARETGEKGATSFEIVGGQAHDLRHHALDVVRFASVSLEAEPDDQPADLLDRLEPLLREERTRAGSRLLALGVTVRGRTRCHGALVERADEFVQNVKGIAAGALGDDVWVADVDLATRAAQRIDLLDLGSAAEPVTHLLQSIERLRSDDAALASLGEELADLASKLPEDLRDELGARAAKDPAAMRQLLDPVRDLLVARVLSGDEP